MKYIVVLGDGMGDYPMKELQNKTPLQRAFKPAMDYMAGRGILGQVKTIPEGFPAGSDIANLSVLGYNPAEHYDGRSPFEAVSMGVKMEDGDVSFRCNLVTLSHDEPYESKEMIDYSAGEVSTGEAEELVRDINKQLGTSVISFHNGISYRHLMLWKGAPYEWKLVPPHDIMGEKIMEYLPDGKGKEIIKELMVKSYNILKDHPINLKRSSMGLNVANSIWLWGEGKRPLLPSFRQKYGLEGVIISAVDLLKGIGIYAGIKPVNVKGATGEINTNYKGKADAAVKSLEEGADFVYLHVEAPDECSHHYEIDNKVKAIEFIDREIVNRLQDQLAEKGIEYKIMILPDHYTPLSLRTHTADPVPFLIYRNNQEKEQTGNSFDELSSSNSGIYFPEGHKLMDYFIHRA